MKKWMIVLTCTVLLFLYGIFVMFWYTGRSPQAEPTETTAVPAYTTDPMETTVATLPPETPPEETVPEETVPAVTVMSPDYILTARHAFVYDCKHQELLYTLGDQQEAISPASLTKLLTAYVALEYLDPDTLVTAGEETTWIDPASSIAFVTPGSTLSVELLVEGMLLQSGNDAAHALAAAAGRVIAEDPNLSPRKAVDTFMAQVNIRAEALGLEDTHFVTPDGLDAEGHHTTPADMLKIAQLAMDNPILSHYAAISSADVTFEHGESYHWLNTNFLLQPDSAYYCSEACGMKTGYTRKAGACMIAVFHTRGRDLIVGIFGCPQYEDRFADALFLYETYR